ncbi:hypothetical protein SUGI_0606540 [Cryptomeria japonica]|nr:hypothetical protein SUGI_0606540 [Cryptomeria japonica]
MIDTLCVYASICKYDELSFKYPSSRITWEQFMDVADAKSISKQEIWVAVEPNSKNQAFNCSNGDVFKWKKLWKQIAEKLELEMIPYEDYSIALINMPHFSVSLSWIDKMKLLKIIP